MDPFFFAGFFYATHRGLRELDCVIRPQFSIFPQNRLSLRAIFGHTTQLNSLLQEGQRSLSATFLGQFTGLHNSLTV